MVDIVCAILLVLLVMFIMLYPVVKAYYAVIETQKNGQPATLQKIKLVIHIIAMLLVLTMVIAILTHC